MATSTIGINHAGINKRLTGNNADNILDIQSYFPTPTEDAVQGLMLVQIYFASALYGVRKERTGKLFLIPLVTDNRFIVSRTDETDYSNINIKITVGVGGTVTLFPCI